MQTMTLGDLRRAILRALEDGADPRMPVLLRVQNDDAETMVGDLFAAQVDPGCTETDAFVLDGSTDAEDDDAGEDAAKDEPRRAD